MTDKAEHLREIKLYLEAAREALASAKLTLANDFYSATASRTYYAIFYAASALLKTKQLSFSKHSAVLSAFRQHFVKTGQFDVDISDFYKVAFETRQAADYQVGIDFQPAELEANLLAAERFVDEVQTWLRQHQFLLD